jgi:3-isopropylmalate/(R)-2-methylmalate dehydratase large subunit
MGMTITEKILADHAGEKFVEPGQFVNVKLDLVLANDITGPVAINEFRKLNRTKVFNREKIALVPDHFTPNKDIQSAQQAKQLREFAQEQELTNYFEIGQMGIEHALLPEKGLVVPGDLVIGADSHTCTYGALGAFSTGVGSTDLAAGMALGETWLMVPESIKFIFKGKLNPWVSGKDLILYTIGQIGVDGALYKSMEFCGEAIEELSMDGRFAMTNMAIEAGAKNGIIAPDEKTIAYAEERAKRPYKLFYSDPDAKYAQVIEFDVSKIEPQISFPHSPANTKPISDVGEITIDQAVIGSCTNGRIEDLRIAAAVLKGKKVHPYTRLIIIPGTQEIYRQAIREGLVEIFLDAGAAFSTPTCGPCLGGHMGILAEGEKCIATTNRNFRGRMGHVTSEIYLASPALAAASAIKGRIVGPEEVR